MSIRVTRPLLPELEDYIGEISDIWDSKWLTNFGPKHEQLRSELINYLDVKELQLFCNGHMALESLIEAFKLSGEVITTPFTFVSTAHAIYRNGLKPIFCDIKYDDYTIDFEKIEKLITEKTEAIVPVHVYGNICDYKNIQRIADKYNLRVIYDAAHAFGIKINGQGAGSLGDASMFSFHATKVFNTIEGGAVSTSSKEISNLLKVKSNFGIVNQEMVDYVGANTKMNEFQAAMGLCNLKNIDEAIGARRSIMHRYIDNLLEINSIKIIDVDINVKSNYAYFPIVFIGKDNVRDKIYNVLCSKGIYARKYFYPLVNDLQIYRSRDSNDTPVAKYISNRVLCLPIYPGLLFNDVDKICCIIKQNL